MKVLKHHFVNRATCRRNLLRSDPLETSSEVTRLGCMRFPRLTAFLYSTLRVMRTINRRFFNDRKPCLSILGIFPGVLPKSVVLIPSLVTSAPGADFSNFHNVLATFWTTFYCFLRWADILFVPRPEFLREARGWSCPFLSLEEVGPAGGSYRHVIPFDSRAGKFFGRSLCSHTPPWSRFLSYHYCPRQQ